MRIDWSGAELFLSYLDDEASLARLWDHPAYELAREHATVLGRELTQEDISNAIAGEDTAFGDLENLADDRDRIERLLDHVRARETEWTDRIARQLERITPDVDVSDLTLHLAIGYSCGVGLRRGAYVNLNESLFHRDPRQVLYTAVHECSHVCYERAHESLSRLDPASAASRADQWRIWSTVFHTEAYATYAPLALRRAEGNVGNHAHPICEDYRVLEDETRMSELVAEYDSFRETLRDEAVSRETLFDRSFAEPRLPYRIGCALLDGLEEQAGLDAVREGFDTDPEAFADAYDWVLDEYRTETGT